MQPAYSARYNQHSSRNMYSYQVPEQTFEDEYANNEEEEPQFVDKFGFDISLKKGKNPIVITSINKCRSSQDEENRQNIYNVFPVKNFYFEEINGGERWDTMPENPEPMLPDDVFKLGNKIERIKVIDTFHKGSKLKVMVLGIFDITKFWISADFPKLEEFTNELENFYESNASNYVIPEGAIKKGLYCVASLNGIFSRAKVVNTDFEDGLVKLFFIDFGVVFSEKKENIWFLTEEFSRFPAQAIRARLAGVRPSHKNMPWSFEAVENFRELAAFQNLTAVIADVEDISNSLWVRLTDDDEVPLTGIMATNGHMIFEREPQQNQITDDKCKAKVEFIQHFPCFEHLENGEVPWSDKINEFYGTTITIDFLIPQYFERCVDKKLIDKVDDKMKKLVKSQLKLQKGIRSRDLKERHRTDELNRIAYGELYDILKPPRKIRAQKESQEICEASSSAVELPEFETSIDLRQMHGMEELNNIAYGLLYKTMRGKPEERIIRAQEVYQRVCEPSPSEPEKKEQKEPLSLRSMRQVRLNMCFR